jgi:hypothetical protein
MKLILALAVLTLTACAGQPVRESKTSAVSFEQFYQEYQRDLAQRPDLGANSPEFVRYLKIRSMIGERKAR